jgi:hypothetical protein
MRIVKTTKAKKGGKSHKKVKQSNYDEAKEYAVNHVMTNLANDAKKIEMQAVTQILEKHLCRNLVSDDVPKIERITNETGYVLAYDGKQLGELRRFHHKDKKEELNYQIAFQPY